MRFGPPPDIEINRLGTIGGNPLGLPPTSINQSPLRPTPVSSLTGMPGGPPGSMSQQCVDSMPPVGIYLGNSGPPNSQQQQQQQQPLPMIKPQKKRKDGTNDYESIASSNRDDVQSPAYSDISDDSTPVIDSDMIGMIYSNSIQAKGFEFNEFFILQTNHCNQNIQK